MNISLIVFPGTNCDHDIEYSCGELLGHSITRYWHSEGSIGSPDIVIIPGGFSYGDYLRCGALAKISPVMQRVKEFASSGGPVLGICNGFQILCESGLLPGVLLQNKSRRFLSRFVSLKVTSCSSFFTSSLSEGDVFQCPVAHFEGNFYIDSNGLSDLGAQNQIVFQYSDSAGVVDEQSVASNPNGSLCSIAGISNREGNVVGLMPHPERSVELLTCMIGGVSPSVQERLASKNRQLFSFVG